MGDSAVLPWVAANAVLHGVIDFWTSKATSHHWLAWLYQHDADLLHAHDTNQPVRKRGNYRIGSFFSIIGFDQFLHVAFLLGSGYAMGVL